MMTRELKQALDEYNEIGESEMLRYHLNRYDYEVLGEALEELSKQPEVKVYSDPAAKWCLLHNLHVTGYHGNDYYYIIKAEEEED